MEQVGNDNKTNKTNVNEVESDSSPISTINEKPKHEILDDDIEDFTTDRAELRSKLIRRTESGSTAGKNPVYIEWHGIKYSIPIGDEKAWNCKKSDIESGERLQKTIIENIHGCASPGEVVAIMGPSGCGKTTFLNVLGDRVGNKGVNGTITLNGHKPTKVAKRYVAYCTQDDIFFPHLTLKDTLSFTARLRLPRELTREEKLSQVDTTMQLLNLTKSANTRIGNFRVRGLSGGERKRANIASELLTDPSVILLDEPTSGLDSSLAHELVKILKEFAVKQRKTIIVVIHQPSSQVFEVFDKLMLMADGRMTYFGRRDEVEGYLADKGFKCYPNYNLADYILELLSDNTSKQKLINEYANKVSKDPSGKHVVEEYSTRKTDDNNGLKKAPVSGSRNWEATFPQQISILVERTFKQSRRDILSTIGLIQTFALTVICCLIWFRIPFTEATLNDRMGNIFFSSIFWAFHPFLEAISAFPLDLDVLTKERQSRSYRLSAYYFSKQIAEFPLVLIKPTLFTIVVYWVSNLLPDFGRFVAYLLVVLLGTLTSQSFGYFFGASLLNIQKCLTVGTVFMLGCMLLGGYYVRNLPTGLTWLKYLSFVTYSYGLLLQIQLDTPKAIFKCDPSASLGAEQQSLCDPLTSEITGKAILENDDFNNLPWYGNLIVLLGICVVVRFIAYFALSRSTKK